MSGKRVKVRIPACRVRERTSGMGFIEDYVNEIIPLVEEDIENAIENEKNYSYTEIDTLFDIPYMSNKDAQRDVYYLLAMVLIKAGYYPEYRMDGRKSETQKVYILVRWKNIKDAQNDTYKDDFLRQITKATNVKNNNVVIKRRRHK